MDTTKNLEVNGKKYQVTMKRFDEALEPKHGADYHGYYIKITTDGISIKARKYDDEDHMSIEEGVALQQSLVKDLRQIAVELFTVNKLKIATSDPTQPYKLI